MREKNAANGKLQCSINEALIYIEEMKKKVQNHIQILPEKELRATSVASSVQKFGDLQTTSTHKDDKKVSGEMENKQSKDEMNEDEKIRKLREYFEATESTVTTDLNM